MKVLLLSKKLEFLKNILPEQNLLGFIPTASEVYDNPIWIEEDKKYLNKMRI